jgi:flagellar transcriptional activator FlhC
MARNKSIIGESADIRRAIELIGLGARLQVLESETRLSRERLLRLYKEVQGKSPPKGMLPFSTDWFMTWQPNIHASLFINIYRFLDKTTELDEIDAIIKAFRLYLEQAETHKMPPVLSITRAWRLVKFFDAGMLATAPCTKCGGHFVVHTMELYDDFVCGLCNMPSRAGKTRAAAVAAERLAA